MFGVSNEAMEEDMNPPQGESMQVMEGYFDNLAAAATNEKHVLEEMVKTMAKLTATNEVLTKTNAGLSHQVTVLQNWKPGGGNNQAPRGAANPGRGGAPRNGAGRTKKECPNCKQEVWHTPTDCFELDANASKRPRNWISRV